MKKEIRYWGADISKEQKNLQDQLDALTREDIFSIDVLPDVHFGYSFPIGTLTKCKTDRIYPQGVGVDIYCGARLEFLKGLKKEELIKALQGKRLVNALNSLRNDELSDPPGIDPSIPLVDIYSSLILGGEESFKTKGFVELTAAQSQTLLKKKERGQLGTLGGGNHFFEIVGDQDGNVGLLVHSGSRGFGAARTRRFLKGELCKLEGEKIIQEYRQEYTLSSIYALINRKMICSRVKNFLKDEGLSFEEGLTLDCPHNYMEEKDGFFGFYKGVLGGLPGEKALVLGNMVQGSLLYILKKDLICHGLGRNKSRKQCWKGKKKLEIPEGLKLIMGKKARVEEAPDCYKNFESVLRNIDEAGLGSNPQILKPIVGVKAD